MGKSNIVIGKSLEQYKSKYKNYKKHLYSFTKKEVEELDKQAGTIGAKWALRKHKWMLIGDTYYQIPRAPRLMWFKGLSGGAKLATCLITLGVVGGVAGTTTYFLLTKQDVKIDDSVSGMADVLEVKKDSDGNKVITIQSKPGFQQFSSITVKIGEDTLTEKEYSYRVSNDQLKYLITIYKATLEKHKGPIIIIPVEGEPEKEFDGTVTDEEWNSSIDLIVGDLTKRNFTVNQVSEQLGRTIETEYCINSIYTKIINKSETTFSKIVGINNVIQFSTNGIITTLHDDSYIDLMFLKDFKNIKKDFTYNSDLKTYHIDIEEPLNEFSYDIKFKDKQHIESIVRKNNSQLFVGGDSTFTISKYNETQQFEIPEITNMVENYTEEGTNLIYDAYSFNAYKDNAKCFYDVDLSGKSIAPDTNIIISLVDNNQDSYLSDWTVVGSNGSMLSPTYDSQNKTISIVSNDIKKISIFAQCTTDISTETDLTLKVSYTPSH